MIHIVLVLALTSAQDLDATARQLLASPTALSEQDLATVLKATQSALANKAFFLYGGFSGGEVQLDADARLQFFRQGTTVTEWTRVPAVTCDGTALERDLIIQWERHANEWQGMAREARGHEPTSTMFTLWDVTPREIEDLGLKDIEGIGLRGLGFAYEPPARAQFDARRQVLWFDPRTLLPVRWEISLELPESIVYGYFLAYAPGLQMGPPADVQRPDCVRHRRIP